MSKTKLSPNWFFLPVAVIVAIVAEVLGYQRTKSDGLADCCAFVVVLAYLALFISIFAIRRAAQRLHIF
jgi:hypothetical protein